MSGFLSRKGIKQMPSSPAPVVADAGGSSASTIAADMETGSHVLTVSGYSGTKGFGAGNVFCSAAFSAAGHSWCIRYYPDGQNVETADWISLFLQLDHDRGANGGTVHAQFKFSLLDQMGEPVPSCTVVSHKHDFSVSPHSWGYPKFIQRKELESSHVKDDSFRISCHVTVFKIRAKSTPVRFLAAPSPDLHRDLGDLLASGVGADVKFKVGTETFAAHRSVLAARSPVFKAELFGFMKEKKAAQVWIDDMEARVFGAMLHFIYTDSLPEIDEGDNRVMAQHLVVAADRYGLQRLKLICEDVLRNFIDTNTAATTLALAEQHGCRRLREGCFNFLKHPGNMKAVMATAGFEHLTSSCPSLLKELLAKLAP